MVGNMILRGLVVGVLAGILAFVFATFFGEPSLDAAIAFEDRLAAASGVAAEPEIVSRAMQRGLGLLTGVVVLGAGLGGLFGVAFAFANGRMGRLGPQQTAAVLALMAFVGLYFLPFLKYPGNPPAANDPDTIQYRTALYFLMMALSLASIVGAWMLRQRLVPRYGNWNGSLIALCAFVLVGAIASMVMPAVSETPADFPAAVLWEFRLASIGVQALIWATIGLGFGALMGRDLAGGTSSREAMPAR